MVSALPVISIVGRKNSGKTTLIEGLIPTLSRRGYRVGTIKHHHYGDFEVDQKGKDSWRHVQAGAAVTALMGTSRVAVFQRVDAEPSVEQVIRLFLGAVDLLLVEGYKEEAFPKIEVVRRAHGQPLCRRDDQLIALVTEGDWGMGVPRFRPDDLDPLADFLERQFLRYQAS
jgi:molybdopterin-guanine dinucleotide biosynthesis protein B